MSGQEQRQVLWVASLLAEGRVTLQELREALLPQEAAT